MIEARLQQLIDNVVAGTASTEDFRELAAHVKADGAGVLTEHIHARLSEAADSAGVFEKAKWERIAEDIISADKVSGAISIARPSHRLHLLRKWGWAAAIALLLGSGAYLWTANKQHALPNSTAKQTVDIAPGKNGAILTLSDGTRLLLDSLANGVIATEKGAQLLLQNGQLAYDVIGEAAGDMVYNTMTTPNGRQFHLQLPDGTQVWLNSASSIKYPTVFSGKDRKVEIDGEAYFEVARNAAMPFKVSINEATEVEVLGTSFNINSYENEPAVKTTLVDGAVRIKAYGQSQTLKPGQQAVATSSRQLDIINNADIEKVLAWKNGLFNFEGASFDEVMKQLERWYDIEVVYEQGIPDIQFVGEMTKDVPLSGLLMMLEKSKVNFRMEGRNLIVLP